MKLYEISESHNEALLKMAEIDDLPQEVITDTMEMLEGEFKDKAISVASFFMNVDAEIQAMKEAEKRMTERRKHKESQVKWMKDYLLSNMERTGITKIECPYFKISVQKNPESVVIVDEDKIPDQFKITETVTKIDKKAIKASGGCEGAEVVRGHRLSIK